MSLSEIFDHGEPHPWANFRINNLTIDGDLLAGIDTEFNITLSGPIPTPTVFSINAGKIGRIASLSFPIMTVSTPGGTPGPFSAPPGSLPADFLPDFFDLVELEYPVRVIDAGVNPTSPGLLIIRSSGEIDLFFDLSGAGFGTVGQRGMYGISITYKTAI